MILLLQEIKLGEADVVLTGGTESMSQAPYAVRNARWGTTLGMDLKVDSHAQGWNSTALWGKPCMYNGWHKWTSVVVIDLILVIISKMEDTLWSSLTDTYAKLSMALTAEKLAEQYVISREDCDQFALSSQQRWTEGMYFNLRLNNTD